MLINSALRKVIAKKDLRKWGEVWNAINILSDHAQKTKGKKPIYRCHSICRALARYVKGVRTVDGQYLGMAPEKKSGRIFLKPRFADHSWLMLPSGSLIDVYPVASMSVPILVVGVGKYAPFGKGLYVSRKSTTKKIWTDDMKRETAAITELLGEALKLKKAAAK